MKINKNQFYILSCLGTFGIILVIKVGRIEKTLGEIDFNSSMCVNVLYIYLILYIYI